MEVRNYDLFWLYVSVRMDNLTQGLSDIVARLNLVVLRPNSGWIVIQVHHFVHVASLP